MDFIAKGMAHKQAIRFFYADVTETTLELARRHETGRTATRILGEALAAAALVSADASVPDEACSLQLNCDGALGGFLVEALGAGTLRGYTKKKRDRQLDRATEPPMKKVLGESGVLNVIVSRPGKVIYSGQVDATPPEVRSALARYYNQSLQTPSAVEIVTLFDKEGRLTRAAGLVAQRMPDGKSDDFVPVLESFHKGGVKAHLAQRTPDGPLWAGMALDDIETVEHRELSFACRCNEESALKSAASLSIAELQEIIDGPGAQEVICHMCGAVYELDEQALLGLFADKIKEQQRDDVN